VSQRVLYVAYPLLPVTEASCGGAEQVLIALEREMARRGHSTAVAAADGSRVAGRLIATGAPASAPDQFEARDREHSRCILEFLCRNTEFDLVHDMSGCYWKHAGEVDVPVLATLHLPPQLYGRQMFDSFPPNLFFNCVSQSQARAFASLPRMLRVVENGIDLSRFTPGAVQGRDSLLWLGRICEEKGPHVALDVAQAAGMPIVIAGEVYPFRYHQEFFEREVKPRLERNQRAQFVRSPNLQEKLELLRGTSALLISSLIDETSSLVAMEAMACHTPVIAFRRGALPEVVEDGVTGFLVDTVEEMVAAVRRVGEIPSRSCRERVEREFSAVRMAEDYEKLYNRVLTSWEAQATRSIAS
jgi:glycosyltransferase involved in cell wall biosynthesis